MKTSHLGTEYLLNKILAYLNKIPDCIESLSDKVQGLFSGFSRYLIKLR